jgi:phage tail tape-measure protein
MLRSAALVLVALSLAAPSVSAQEPATHIRASLAHVQFERAEAPSAQAPRLSQRRPATGRTRSLSTDAGIVAGLAILGLYGGMVVASQVALPCHCDDPEAVVARGGLVGALAGATVGVIITPR